MLSNNVTTEIWEFCIKMGVYISAAHIPRNENIIADLASREFQDSYEWIIYSKYWILICLHLDVTKSFQYMHHGCQIRNLASLNA